MRGGGGGGGGGVGGLLITIILKHWRAGFQLEISDLFFKIFFFFLS